MSTLIHPTAVVDPQAQLGVEVQIGPYNLIGPNVRIGDRTRIGPQVVIDGVTTIGADNKIVGQASIGAEPQDISYKGEPTQVMIGDGNMIREFVTINRGTLKGGALTRVGSDVTAGHQETVVPDSGHSSPLDRPPVDGDKFTNGVPVTDLEASLFSSIREVLRVSTEARLAMD